MDQKKLKMGDVTNTGWWRQQRVPKKKSTTPVEVADEKNVADTVSIPSQDPKPAVEKEPSTEGTLSRVFKKLDFF